MVFVAFTEKGTGAFTLVNFVDFVRTDLFVRSFWNSLYVSAMSVVVGLRLRPAARLFHLALHFRGAAIVQTLGFLPLIMPPFVGAVAMQLLFGRNGIVNLLLDDWFGFKIPFMEGLNGVIFVQSIHYFPFILINLSAALRNIDRSMEEAAQNLGSLRLSAVPPHRVSARDAGLCRRRVARLRQGLRRPRDAAAAQRQGHAGAAGLSARHLDRHRGSDGLRHLGGSDRGVDRRDVALGARHCAAPTTRPCSAAAAGLRSAR